MSSIQWWRSWHGAPMDNKWPVIALRAGVKVGIVSAIAWALMDYASQHKERGSIDGFDTEVYAVYSGFTEDEIKSVIKAMEDKGIICDNHLTNWEKRQPQREDSSNERVTQWRDMKRNVTQCNAEISPEKRRGDKDIREDKEESNESLPFENTKNYIEQLTGLPAIPQSIKAIDEIIDMGALPEDITAGYEWFRGQGKTIKYYSQLVGPTKTAMSIRINGNGNTSKDGIKKVMHMDKLVDPRDIGYVLYEGKWIDPRNIPTEIY